VGPDVFIPIAESSGQIVEIGRWVLERACRQVAAWHAQGHLLSVAVNVSGRQLDHDRLIGDVCSALHGAELDPSWLTLEITETTLMRDPDATAERLAALKDLGVRIAIDDFGTGYSSLSRLHQFPLDYLKIDSGFVAGMSERTEDAVIVSCVLALARGLGVRTIAEGIEEGSQLEQLAASGCEYGQGWLWSPAVPFDEALAMVATGRAFRKAVVTSTT
jgi:EAL domain-containing protein (putative c-di-GMP-specific phosphodiesterase class I)